jgi:hypothetical protein
MKALFILLAIAMLSCNNKRETGAGFVLEEYAKHNKALNENKNLSVFLTYTDTSMFSYKGAEYKVITNKFPEALSLYYVKGYLLDNPNPYGTYFHFDKDGNLLRYLFLCGEGNRNTYQLDYSSKSDQYEEQGDAFVDHFAPANIKEAGNLYSLLFSTFPRTDIEAFYSVDKINFQKLNLRPQALDPFTSDAEITLSKKEIANGIIIRVKSKNLRFPLKGLQDLKETYDTLTLAKNEAP